MMNQQALKTSRPQVIRRPRVPSDSAFCSYSHRTCMQIRLDGHEFCAKHILEDKNTTYKQCNYVSNKTAKRCSNAALKSDKKEGYCGDHARRANQARHRISKKRKAKETPETLFDELEHYTPRSHSNNHSSGSETKKSRASENLASKIMEYGSSTDSESEGMTVDQTWRGDGESDAESVDSEQEDPLKHAGVYTAEEVALITRDKLIRLQSLYIDQFKRLQHVMKEKRRRYLHTVRKEREALGSINYAKDDPEQRQKYEELVAMKRYHRRFGQEALLHRQSKERRIAVSEGPNYRPPTFPKCILSKNGGKCGARTVPLSKYCADHIIHDPHQVLFASCGFGGACSRPVGGLFDDSSCMYHAQPEDIEYRLPHKKEEKDESRDEIDVVGGHDSHSEEQSLQLQLQLQQEQLDADSPILETAGGSKGGTFDLLSNPAGLKPEATNKLVEDTGASHVESGAQKKTLSDGQVSSGVLDPDISQKLSSPVEPYGGLSIKPTHQGEAAPGSQTSPNQVPSVVDDLLAAETKEKQKEEKLKSPIPKKRPVSPISHETSPPSSSQIPTTVEEKGPVKGEGSESETINRSDVTSQPPVQITDNQEDNKS